MYNNQLEPAKRIFAIVNRSGYVVWSRGGSSTPPKLMVYDSEKKADRAMKNYWTKQAHKGEELEVMMIYCQL